MSKRSLSREVTSNKAASAAAASLTQRPNQK